MHERRKPREPMQDTEINTITAFLATETNTLNSCFSTATVLKHVLANVMCIEQRYESNHN